MVQKLYQFLRQLRKYLQKMAYHGELYLFECQQYKYNDRKTHRTVLIGLKKAQNLKES